MSTKIYNAFKLKSSASLGALSELFSEAKKEIEEILCLDLANRISESYYYELDKARALGNVDSPHPTIGEQIQAMENKLRDDRWLFRNFTDNNCQIIPHKDSLYALTFVGTVATSEALHRRMKTFGFEDYSYWNNEEKPAEVTEAEWLERKEVWDEIFSESSAPIDHGFSKVFTTMDTFIRMFYVISERRDEFIKAPPIEVRLKNLFDDVLDERAAALIDQDPKLGPYSALSRVRDYFKKDETGIAEERAILERFEAAIRSTDETLPRQGRSPRP